jgi:hypothetical protein
MVQCIMLLNQPCLYPIVEWVKQRVQPLCNASPITPQKSRQSTLCHRNRDESRLQNYTVRNYGLRVLEFIVVDVSGKVHKQLRKMLSSAIPVQKTSSLRYSRFSFICI